MSNTEHERNEEQKLARLLKAVGAREQLPANLAASWEKRFREELQAARRARATRQRRWAAGLSAAALIVTTALLIFPGAERAEFPVIRVVATATVNTGGSTPSNPQRTLAPGQVLEENARVATRGGERVSLDYAGYDLRLNANTEVVFNGTRIQLDSGMLYASSETARPKQLDLLIETPLGTVRNIGTQFTVAVENGQTVATVRRGAVLLQTDVDSLRADAVQEGATQLSVDSMGGINRSVVASSGPRWGWIYRAGRQFQLEGSSAAEFLQWAASETGLTLEFETSAAEIYASTAILHGKLATPDPEAAITPVLAVTDLNVRTDNKTITVSLRPGR